ncbi:MAG: prolipoprotein diacylglyceryl transferase family protein, partial [Candidatus Dormibacterales bacterium]
MSAGFARVVVDASPDIARLGPLAITWRGAGAVAGTLAAVWLAKRALLRRGAPAEGIWSAAVWAVVAGWGAATATGIATHGATLAGWRGVVAGSGSDLGLPVGLAAGAAAVALVGRRARLTSWATLDAAAPAVVAGLGLAALATLVAGGADALRTTLPWGVQYVASDALARPGVAVQPLGAYVAALALGVLALMTPLRRPRPGMLPAGVPGLSHACLFATGMLAVGLATAGTSVLGLQPQQWAWLAIAVAAAAALT